MAPKRLRSEARVTGLRRAPASIIASDSDAIQTKPLPQTSRLDRLVATLLAMAKIGVCWRPRPASFVLPQPRRRRPAARPVEQLDRVDDRHGGRAGDLGQAADVAGGDDIGLQPFEMADLARA